MYELTFDTHAAVCHNGVSRATTRVTIPRDQRAGSPFACRAAACLPGRAQAAPTPRASKIPTSRKRTAKAFVDRALERAFYVACPIVDGGEVLLLRRVDASAGMPAEAASCSISVFASVFTFATIVVTSDPFISC